MRAPSVLLSILLLAATAGRAASEAGPPEVLGYIGEDPITSEEVDDLLAAEMRKLRQQEYDLRLRGLGQIVAQRLVEREAAARGVTVEDLFRAEIQDKTTPPTAEDVTAFYEENKARIGDRTLESVRVSIENVLRNQELAERRKVFLAGLRAKVSIRVLLEPLRTEVSIPADAPSRGPESAPVTLVEFSDYQCPFCRRAHPALEEVLARYGDRVRFVYLDYPLPNHSRAVPASQAARCAGEQGKYWDYHENLMTFNGPLTDEDLKTRAVTPRVGRPGNGDTRCRNWIAREAPSARDGTLFRWS